MRDCVDSASWRNAIDGATCADYEARSWCAGGAVLNASASGPIFGAPELSCCACGSARDVATSDATSLLFMATHVADEAIAGTLSHLARDLSRRPSLHHRHPWVLLFVTEPPPASTVARWRSLDAHVCPWTLKQVFGIFPRLAKSFRKSAAVIDTEEQYLKHYFLFHTSLALWWQLFGRSHPRITHFWRVEPDVQLVGAGGWAALMERASRMRADVLLPQITLQANSEPEYTHWLSNRAYAETVQPSKRAWSLVCVGRYSLAFIRNVMWPQWADGTLAYEEIFLPTSCLAARNCSVATFGSLVDARHVVFRPFWDCSQFRPAWSSPTLELWHPIKDAACVAAKHAWAEADGAWSSGALQPLPPPSPPSSPPHDPRSTAGFRHRGREGSINANFRFSEKQDSAYWRRPVKTRVWTSASHRGRSAPNG